MRKSAVVEKENGEWARPLWAERFSLENLKKIKMDMGEYRFEREYMCRPRATGDTLFPMELIMNSLDHNAPFEYTTKGMVYVGCDFAMSTTETGDYNVFTVIDSYQGTYRKQVDKGYVDIENPVIIRKIIRFKGSGQIDNIKSLYTYFTPHRCIVDSSGVGARFVQELMENRISVDAQDFRPANRNMLLLNLRRLMEQNRLIIPTKGECETLTNHLINELSGFRTIKTRAGSETFASSLKHDDMVMSLAMAVKEVSQPRKPLETIFFGA
jgi:hypothetical protein